jgi:hypothetical protein
MDIPGEFSTNETSFHQGGYGMPPRGLPSAVGLCNTPRSPIHNAFFNIPTNAGNFVGPTAQSFSPAAFQMTPTGSPMPMDGVHFVGHAVAVPPMSPQFSHAAQFGHAPIVYHPPLGSPFGPLPIYAPANSPVTPNCMPYVPVSPGTVLAHSMASHTGKGQSSGTPMQPRNTRSERLPSLGGSDKFIRNNQKHTDNCPIKTAPSRRPSTDGRKYSAGNGTLDSGSPGTKRKELVKAATYGSFKSRSREFAVADQQARTVVNTTEQPYQFHPKYKTISCDKFYSSIGCPYAERCHFRHPGDPPSHHFNSGHFSPMRPMGNFAVRHGNFDRNRQFQPSKEVNQKAEMNSSTAVLVSSLQLNSSPVKRSSSESSLTRLSTA